MCVCVCVCVSKLKTMCVYLMLDCLEIVNLLTFNKNNNLLTIEIHMQGYHNHDTQATVGGLNYTWIYLIHPNSIKTVHGIHTDTQITITGITSHNFKQCV